MSDQKKVNRRDFIYTASTVVGVVGVGAAAWPLIDQMNPDASVKALATTEVDVSLVKPCLLYTSPSPRDGLLSRMPSSA